MTARDHAAAFRLAYALRRRWKLLCVLATLLGLGLGLGIALAACGKRNDAFQLRTPIPSGGAPFASALFQSLGVRFQPGHDVRLFDNGAVFDILVDDISHAKSSVHVLMYIWEKGKASDRVVAAIVERAEAGVACRILVDDLGSPKFGKEVQAPLVAAGCEVRIIRPLPGVDKLARNHRKLVMIDGRIGLTGGFGIRDNWLGDGVHDEAWRDVSVRFSGPAVMDAQQAFAENWQEAGGALLPPEAFADAETGGPSTAAFVSSTASPVLTRAERLTQLLIAAAKKRIWIANAYFVPSHAILELLMSKASDGVDVRVLAPGKRSDSKTSFGMQHVDYGPLMKRGVRVWEYTPSMMHAKTMVIDETLILVGSINLDPLSLNKLDEGSLLVADSALTSRLAETFLADCAHATELSSK